MATEAPRKGIVVVGGGIGGLAAGLALGRAGWPVSVVERVSEFTEIGAGIELAANATRILDAWSLLEPLIERAVVPRRLVLRSAINGDELTALALRLPYERRYGAPYVVCHRNDLLSLLLGACQEHPLVDLHPGRAVTEIEPAASEVRVHCADGKTLSAAGVVGADGLRSQVRGLLSDDELVCSGYVSYRGAIPLTAATRPSALDEVVGWIGPGLHFVQYALHADDLYNQVAVFRSAEYAAGVSEWGSPVELNAAFAGASEPVRAALGAIRRDARWYMFDREPLATWTDGRVTLLGDAAHPMLQYLAQGACQALEDAMALGIAVDRHTDHGRLPDGLPSALVAYQEARIEQASRVQRNARLWGDIWHTNDPLAVTLRDALFSSRSPDDYRFTDWLYQPQECTRA